MAARAHDIRENTASRGATWPLPMLDQAETACSEPDMTFPNTMEDEPLSGVASKKRSGRVGSVAWFAFAIAVIGSISALAWRGYAEIHSITERQANDQATIQRLELAYQQMGQRVDALQQAQQQHEQSRLGDVQRMSLQLTALQNEVEKLARKQTEQLDKAAKSEPRPATRKKNEISSTAGTSRTRSVARGSASEPSSTPDAEQRN